MTDQAQEEKKKTPAKPRRGGIGGIDARFFGSPDNGTPVDQDTSKPASQYDSKPVQQQTGLLSSQLTSIPVDQDTSKPVTIKGTYYITDVLDMKLERIRLARRARGIHVDKSALVREAIDLLQESDAQPIASPAPVEQKPPASVVREIRNPTEVEAQQVVMSLPAFADQHFVSRNEAEQLWKRGMIAGVRHVGKGVMLYPKGLHDFWIQFHETPGFRACNDCPHK